MATVANLKERLKEVFEDRQASVIADVIFTSYNELVKTSDFAELKGIVKELAEAQKESQKGISRLDKAVQELAEAQKRTEIRVEELAEAQKRTELRVEELAEAQKKTEQEIKMLTRELRETRKEILKEIGDVSESLKLARGDFGGLSRSMGYALENEAFRILPGILKKKYGIDVQERLIRVEVGGKEINVYGKGKMGGKDILIVGEARLRLDERRFKKEREDMFEELEEKVKAVQEEEGDVEILRLLITHFATSGFLREAKERGIIVIQSFEW